MTCPPDHEDEDDASGEHESDDGDENVDHNDNVKYCYDIRIPSSWEKLKTHFYDDDNDDDLKELNGDPLLDCHQELWQSSILKIKLLRAGLIVIMITEIMLYSWKIWSV